MKEERAGFNPAELPRKKNLRKKKLRKEPEKEKPLGECEVTPSGYKRENIPDKKQ